MNLCLLSKLVPDFDNLTNTMTATLTLEQYPQSADTVTTAACCAIKTTVSTKLSKTKSKRCTNKLNTMHRCIVQTSI